MKRHHSDTLDAHYTINQGGRAPRKLPKWRYRQHDISEYLEALNEEEFPDLAATS